MCFQRYRCLRTMCFQRYHRSHRSRMLKVNKPQVLAQPQRPCDGRLLSGRASQPRHYAPRCCALSQRKYVVFSLGLPPKIKNRFAMTWGQYAFHYKLLNQKQ